MEATRNLSFEEQTALVFKLKKRLAECDTPEDTQEVRDLILFLRRRDDLLAKIADEIAPLLGSLKEALAVQPENPNAHATPPAKHPKYFRSETQPARQDAPLESEVLKEKAVGALHRVLDGKESWVLAADQENYIALNSPANRWPCLQAQAHFRSDLKGEKKRFLRGLGWKVSGGWIRRYLAAMILPWAFTAAAIAGLLEESRNWVAGYTDRYGDYISGHYVTDRDYVEAAFAVAAIVLGLSVLAPLTRTMRNYLMRKKATRNWMATDPAHSLPEITTELIEALRKMAPDGNLIRIEPYRTVRGRIQIGKR